MKDLGLKYPDYYFEKIRAMELKKHVEAIKTKGVLKNVHRKVFFKKNFR